MSIDDREHSNHTDHIAYCELGRWLAAAVDCIEPPPDIVERARAGGRRRLRRHRALTAAAVVILTAVASLLASVAHPLADHRFDPADRKPVEKVSDPYAWLLTGPTRGDLAHDRAHIQQAIRKWREFTVHSTVGTPYGDPKVAWAGHTTLGEAAIVVQQLIVDPDGPGSTSPKLGTLLAAFALHGNGSEAMYFTTTNSDVPREGAYRGFLFGQTLVILDGDRPPFARYATKRLYADDGSINWDWNEIVLRDGAAAVQLPPATNLSSVRLRNSPRPVVLKQDAYGRIVAMTSEAEFAAIAGQPQPPPTSPNQLLWGGKQHAGTGCWSLGCSVPNSWAVVQSLAEELRQAVSQADPGARRIQAGPWYVYGPTEFSTESIEALRVPDDPDAAAIALEAAVMEVAFDDEPSHVYAIVKNRQDGTTRILHGGVPDRNAALPIRLKLPDGSLVAISLGAKMQHRPVGAHTWPMTPQFTNVLAIDKHDLPAEVQVTAMDARRW